MGALVVVAAVAPAVVLAVPLVLVLVVALMSTRTRSRNVSAHDGPADGRRPTANCYQLTTTGGGA